MPRVAYSEKDKERIRTALITVGLELMAKQGIQHTTVEQVYKKVGKESYQVFRQKQRQLFGKILETFGIEADARRINLFTNLSLTVMVIRRALPDTLPLFVPEAADETIDVQLDAIVDVLEKLKTASSS